MSTWPTWGRLWKLMNGGPFTHSFVHAPQQCTPVHFHLRYPSFSVHSRWVKLLQLEKPTPEVRIYLRLQQTPVWRKTFSTYHFSSFSALGVLRARCCAPPIVITWWMEVFYRVKGPKLVMMSSAECYHVWDVLPSIKLMIATVSFLKVICEIKTKYGIHFIILALI